MNTRHVPTPELVAYLREKLNLTPKELADALGMGKRGVTLVRKWENGTAIPTAAALTAVKLLVRVDQLEAELSSQGFKEFDEPRVDD